MNAEIDFPALVSQIRRVRGLTQEQLAHELGVTFGTVNGWENGKHQPSPLAARELLRIAVDSGIDVGDHSRGRFYRPSERSKDALADESGKMRRKSKQGGKTR